VAGDGFGSGAANQVRPLSLLDKLAPQLGYCPKLEMLLPRPRVPLDWRNGSEIFCHAAANGDGTAKIRQPNARIKLLILLADCALDGPVGNEPWNVPLL
jgi:hypothetical protein